ncbi:MAG: D-tyrosyl-tRNA(Tyr) deacylase [Candidatus Blackburnbacteria bacterium RIFCSPLOWO2_01_FULL_41_27]|uniref:D-aminoacyl-tRNA deacylase n=2 Tax=Candidatus Blackburniibacteriota TaxID=1817898 RepID=A0A1G1V9C1_9BACT|nr:MAG: D-tyrosyl-tRNA(Tyr) deacylase [Candidatus Blackburnbacteria bacterium RIFCSPHIGHO2_12_FULL_41_13b]OGY13362.1 MAG: D-tyrosyl-tRNA(Tyr) deacylase [Candidatus Blackburnbacteria bacterium RIFCSPLOWO2_01_FULL_41_27]
MKLIIQRVKKAKVTSEGKTVGEIGSGLFVLLGVGKQDSFNTVFAMAQKCVDLRIMADKDGKMNLSVKDVGGEILVVSQFTLYADTSRGRRPSFVNAAEPELAKQIYTAFIEKLRELGVKVEIGSFGNYMEIESVADGPVTIILES